MSRRFTPRGALLALLLLAAACGRPREEAREVGEPTSPAPSFELPSECAPDAGFCESSAAFGLRDGRAHGRGVSLVDVDGDGWTDIWRSDSGMLADEGVHRAALYRNEGDGSFEAWDVGIAPEHTDMNWAGIFGDIDDDGDPDLVLVNGGYEGLRPCAVYLNALEESGRFVDVTAESGLARVEAGWWSGAFADFDGDGWLDLVLTARAYDDYLGPGELHLYRNLGGTFEEVSDSFGLPEVSGDLKNPTWFDYDRDGDLDLLLVRAQPEVGLDDQTGLFENRGEEGFVRVDPSVFPGDEAIAADSIFVFAAAAADFDQDGWEDVYLGRWDHQDVVVHNLGGGAFEVLGAEIGIDAPSELNTMGLGVGDMDGDGYPDVFVGPGDPWTARPPVVYCNTGIGLGFVRCDREFEEVVPSARWHGVAFGDLNRDFRVDVVANLGGFAVYDRDMGEDTADWLTVFMGSAEPGGGATRLRLVGTESPTTPIGAEIRLDASRSVYYTLHNAQGFASINDEWVVLPMGARAEAPARVRWPSGLVEVFDVRAGAEMTLVEGEGHPPGE